MSLDQQVALWPLEWALPQNISAWALLDVLPSHWALPPRRSRVDGPAHRPILHLLVPANSRGEVAAGRPEPDL